jgi:hypothetical protein
MRKFGFCLMALLVMSAASVGRAQSELYFLKFNGKANPLAKVSVNGATVVSGTIVSVHVPLPVTKHLRNGENTLEVEYASDSKEGLTIELEKRNKGSAKGEIRPLFSSPPAATKGQMVKGVVKFNLQLNVTPKQNVVLTETDKQAIQAQIQSYYAMLSKRDTQGVLSATERAFKEMKEANPQLAKSMQQAILEVTQQCLSSPQFKMKPLRLEKLQFSADGELVMVRRSDGLPIFASEEVEVIEEVISKQDGKEMRTKVKSKTQIVPTEMTFKKYGGEWQMVFRYE